MLPRVERSVTVMTGMIVAGLYSILLIGVTRESYMKHDAAKRDAVPRFDLANARAAPEPVSKRACLPEHPLCATLFDDATERQNCAASVRGDAAASGRGCAAADDRRAAAGAAPGAMSRICRPQA